MKPSLFEKIGGEPKIRKIVTDFYELVFSDVMIGHMFLGKDKSYLIEKEIELASNLFGKSQVYSGRPLDLTHKPLKIRACQFDRRVVLLKKVFTQNNFNPVAQVQWLEHTESLRTKITIDGERSCEEITDPKKIWP